jgi:hypothetical protein
VGRTLGRPWPGIPVQVDVLARQRDDHQRCGAQRIDLFRAVVLRRCLGSRLLVEQLPERRGFLLAFQRQERVALAEAR